MNREEYFAAVKQYKEGKLEHRAVDAEADNTKAAKALEDWKKQYYNQAVALLAKRRLAIEAGRNGDADTYEKQYNVLVDKMTNLKGIPVSSKQTILSDISTAANRRAENQMTAAAKHSDEPDDGEQVFQ